MNLDDDKYSNFEPCSVKNTRNDVIEINKPFYFGIVFKNDITYPIIGKYVIPDSECLGEYLSKYYYVWGGEKKYKVWSHDCTV